MLSPFQAWVGSIDTMDTLPMTEEMDPAMIQDTLGEALGKCIMGSI